MEKTHSFTQEQKTKMILMHKDIEVLTFNITDRFRVTEPIELLNKKHLPLFLQDYELKEVDSRSIEDWISSRTAPEVNERMRNLLNSKTLKNKTDLITKWFFCSLSDCYWVKPRVLDLDWESINLFDNGYKNESLALLEQPNKVNNIKKRTPNHTATGQLMKMWQREKDKNYLYKSGSGIRQEPINEIVANMVQKSLGLNRTKYTLLKNMGYYTCKCECYCSNKLEEVTAWDLLGTVKNTDNSSLYRVYTSVLREELGEKSVLEFDKMLIADFIIGNTDRHMNNFGLLRNPDTLEFVKQIPVFDSGSSLGVNLLDDALDASENYSINSLESDELSQIRNIKTKVKIYNFNKTLDQIEILLESCRNITDTRKKSIISFIRKRYVILKNDFKLLEEVNGEECKKEKLGNGNTDLRTLDIGVLFFNMCEYYKGEITEKTEDYIIITDIYNDKKVYLISEPALTNVKINN